MEGPVYRLNQTWDGVQGKHKEQWLSLKKLFITQENRKYASLTFHNENASSPCDRNYRERVKEVGGAMNPAFSFYLTVCKISVLIVEGTAPS